MSQIWVMLESGEELPTAPKRQSEPGEYTREEVVAVVEDILSRFPRVQQIRIVIPEDT